ncbi:hypothetical protein Tco_0473261, partial [Tanacetum coccineum]
FLALGWHLKEIHVTSDHLEKKRTRLRRIMFLERGDGATSTKRRRRDLFGDGV